MRVLGVCFGHSTAAALVEDGKIISAVEEEKISRIKGHVTFPCLSLEYLFKKYSLSPKDIDIVAVGCENISEFSYSHRILNSLFGKKDTFSSMGGLFYDRFKTLSLMV